MATEEIRFTAEGHRLQSAVVLLGALLAGAGVFRVTDSVLFASTAAVATVLGVSIIGAIVIAKSTAKLGASWPDVVEFYTETPIVKSILLPLIFASVIAVYSTLLENSFFLIFAAVAAALPIHFAVQKSAVFMRNRHERTSQD
ncbi:hypothetical protein [Altererythrobacter sp. GH1-8]|uniref:hypothetical protein n=1 Tax=Altererythrobacter sp. GH1-8 TaxID=3349333 RepID=UPI00374D17A0